MKITKGLFEIVEKEEFGKGNYTVQRLSDGACFLLWREEWDHLKLTRFNVDQREYWTFIEIEVFNTGQGVIISEEYCFNADGEAYEKDGHIAWVPLSKTDVECEISRFEYEEKNREEERKLNNRKRSRK
ncbi:hypothetical protein [Bacillus cereus]|uniref:Uncharacterized protein n=1 Tax=Bacillus cereus TaxID=1396 RepID=A0A162PCJ1_BACCE|nr:hypothetical protein [Bacillus cereus]KZD70966.1 hypothetical protein B4088_1022 [Bacillus cereus]